MLDNSAWDRAGDLLTDSDFYRFEHRHIYAAIGALWLVDAHAVRAVTDGADYGISAVWASCAGVVCVAGARGELPRPRLAIGIGVICLLGFVVLVPANGGSTPVISALAKLCSAITCRTPLCSHTNDKLRGIRPSRTCWPPSTTPRRPASWA